MAKLHLRFSDLYASPATRPRSTAPRPGFTLNEYAAAKQLPVDFLSELGLSTVPYRGGSAVGIPYRDRAGIEIATRYRISLEGDKFRWQRGRKPPLYGSWRLPEARAARYCALVEGESDAHTLWYQQVPCIAVPGAATWRETWADDLDGIEKIFVVVEPDRGGEAIIRWLGTSRIRDRAWLVRPGAKDVSALYLRDPAGFLASWRALLETARPWADLAPDAVTRRWLKRLIEKRGGSVTPYELAHAGPRRYRGRVELAEAALQGLVASGDAHWEEGRPGPRGGRPSGRFVLDSPSFGVGNPLSSASVTSDRAGVGNPIGGVENPELDRNGEVCNAKRLRIREGSSLLKETEIAQPVRAQRQTSAVAADEIRGDDA